jgi:hypothetical protein
VEVVVEQRRRVVLDDQHDVTAVTAVAAVGAAERLELLAVDGRAAVPAVAGGDVQHDAIDEAGHGVLSKTKGGPGSPGPPYVTAARSASRPGRC